jgi:DNA-binding transcriptional ArsR family regulator
LSASSSRPVDAARELADVEAVFRALAHASRRQILLVLRFHDGSMTAGEIADRFACSWPTTTRHLRVLEEAGLVVVEPRGRERIYRLDAERLLAVTGGWTQWFQPLVTDAPTDAPVPARPRKR